MNKHIKECVRIVSAAGLRIAEVRYGSKHLKIVTNHGLLIAPSTPSSKRWVAELRTLAARKAANDNLTNSPVLHAPDLP